MAQWLKPMEGIGYTRLFGFTTTVAAVPVWLQQQHSRPYTTSQTRKEKQLEDMFAAQWSKNSTLLPINKKMVVLNT